MLISTFYAQEIKGEGDHDSWLYIISRPGLRQTGEKTSQLGNLYYKNVSPQAVEGLQITTNLGTFEYSSLKNAKGVRIGRASCRERVYVLV